METYTEYLEHYGVKGMRWGIIRTPEQLGHRKTSNRKQSNSQNSQESIRKGKIDWKAERKMKTSAKKAEKKRQIAEKKIEAYTKKADKKRAIAEKKAANKAKNDMARREKILNDPTLLYKHRKEFSPEEIRKAMSNIQMEQSLQQLSINQLSTGATYLNAALKYAEAGIKVYNNAAKIYNAFNKQNKKAPIIGQGKEKKKDKEKNKDDDD